MKKLFVICFSFMMALLGCMNSYAVVQAADMSYDEEQKRTIATNYADKSETLKETLEKNDDILYWQWVDEMKKTGFDNFIANLGSGNVLTQCDYEERLAALATLQSGVLAEEIENQSKYNAFKDGEGYALDLQDIAINFAGAKKYSKDFAVILAVIGTSKDFTVDNIDTVDEVKCYEMTVKDFVQSKLFYDTVAANAENKMLKKAAKALSAISEQVYSQRISYLTGDYLENDIKYTAKYYMNHFAIEALKLPELGKDELVKILVSDSEILLSSVPVVDNPFKATMLAGDVPFDTSNTYSKYRELCTLVEIVNSLVKENDEVTLPSDYKDPESFEAIQTKDEYYKMLVNVHARGEYIFSQLEIEDGWIQSAVKDTEAAKSNTTAKEWYEKRQKVLESSCDELDEIFDAGEGTLAQFKGQHAIAVDINQDGALEVLTVTEEPEEDIPSLWNVVVYSVENEKATEIYKETVEDADLFIYKEDGKAYLFNHYGSYLSGREYDGYELYHLGANGEKVVDKENSTDYVSTDVSLYMDDDGNVHSLNDGNPDSIIDPDYAAEVASYTDKEKCVLVGGNFKREGSEVNVVE